ncbi:MetQ/NlpA family ABC transporter substrate-binding protein [Peptoniphilus raoultii]|uniref:MetQ/NlpA family ABC transporter substrate-binding protein n=1 Tax=Peptoniphilus raoultii TaxID=1776387 RepID=UPI0008D8E073|nr:MetQ/NlpA family ABC transporter substrate-binding protein [Peptoniphilus raoultii]
MKKLRILGLLSLALILSLTGCGSKEAKENAGANASAASEEKPANATTTDLVQIADDNEIVIGVSPTPHKEIIDALQDKFTEVGLEVKTVVFDDYVQPNLQLSAGDINANYFQHLPYLEEFTADRKIDNLSNLGFVHLEPLGLYSDKYKSVDEIEDGADIIIPNDPTNGARALILLEDAGLIKLADKTNLKTTEKDIVENPHNFKFTAVEAASVSQLYKDAGAGIINSNYALSAGLNPVNDSLFTESKDSPYANLVAIRTEDLNKEKFQKFIEILQSEDAKKFIEEKYQGAIIATSESK